MATKKDVTVYIGRFNPFHQGHAHVLEAALRTSKLTIILVGSSGQSRSLKNPFSFEERKRMIEDWIRSIWPNLPKDSGDYAILPLRDHPYNDNDWFAQVQGKVKDTITTHCRDEGFNGRPTILTDVHITGSDRDDSTWYLHAFPQWKPALVPVFGGTTLNATEIRSALFDLDTGVRSAVGAVSLTRLLTMLPQTTYRFLEAFIGSPEHTLLTQEFMANKAYKKAWSVAPYAPIFSTVDNVVIQSGHILVVERANFPGKGLWALPGGFVNQTERLIDAAIRELIEETGIKLASGNATIKILKGSMRGKEIFDKPDRSSRGRTITTAFLFRLDDTQPLPRVSGQNVPDYESGGQTIVETARAFWLPISRALTETSNWFEDHHAIVEWAASVPDHR